MRITILTSLCIALWLASTAGPSAAAMESRPVRFAKGASETTLTGTLKGDQVIDYKLRAQAGQTLAVSLKTGNPGNYFNVLPPKSKDLAIFVGSTGGNDWSGALPTSGEYTVRVYLMRNAARRNESANFALTVGVTGAASAAAPPAKGTTALGTAPAADAKVKGSPYHATGKVPCTMGTAAPAQCDFGVVRGAAGRARVHLTPPGGLERVLEFNGNAVTDTKGGKVKASKQGDEWSVEVNDFESYRVPEAVISGG